MDDDPARSPPDLVGFRGTVKPPDVKLYAGILRFTATSRTPRSLLRLHEGEPDCVPRGHRHCHPVIGHDESLHKRYRCPGPTMSRCENDNIPDRATDEPGDVFRDYNPSQIPVRPAHEVDIVGQISLGVVINWLHVISPRLCWVVKYIFVGVQLYLGEPGHRRWPQYDSMEHDPR
ncbi:MAG: hypothetical protein WCQ69_07220 [Bacteroidales bacterium]